MKLTLEMYDNKYTFETDKDDYNGDQMKEIFTRMLVQAGYPASVIDCADGGHFECKYVDLEEAK